MTKVTWMMTWSGLQWQPGGSPFPPLLGRAVVSPLKWALDPVLGAQLCLQRGLSELADFSLVWSFVVCFLARGDHPPSMECPGLLTKVTPTGRTNPGSGQPFCCWLTASLDLQLHSVLLTVWGSRPFHDLNNMLMSTCASLPGVEHPIKGKPQRSRENLFCVVGNPNTKNESSFNLQNFDSVAFFLKSPWTSAHGHGGWWR